MSDAVPGRSDRRKSQKECNGDCKDELWTERKYPFAVLNVLQLVGWTAIMIYDGALAADGVMHTGRWIWCLVIGALIILWIVIGITNLGKINTVAMAALFILTLILCKVIFTGSGREHRLTTV